MMSLCELPVADDKKRGYELRFKELGAAESFDDIRTVRGEHPSEAHAYRITRKGRSLFYNGESSFTKEVLDLAHGVDLFISTAVVLEPHSFHLSPEDIGKAATEVGAKRVAVVHWPTEFEGKREEFAELAKKHFAGEVIVPDDFTVVEV